MHPHENKRHNFIKGLIVAITVVIVVMFIIAGVNRSAESEIATRKPEASLSAMGLWSEYMNNEIGADAAYKGKTVMITGMVSQIGKSMFGTPYVEFWASNEFENVHCEIASSSIEAAGRLSRGLRNVRVTGKVVGLTGSSVLMTDCRVEEQQRVIIGTEEPRR